MVLYCPTNLFLLQLYQLAKISVAMQHLQTDATDVYNVYNGRKCLCASASYIELWLNSLNASEWASYLLVYTCDQLQYIYSWSYKKYDAFVQIATIRSFCIGKLIALSSPGIYIECNLTSNHFELKSTRIDCTSVLIPFAMFNVWRYKSCSMHFHFDLNGWHSSLLRFFFHSLFSHSVATSSFLLCQYVGVVLGSTSGAEHEHIYCNIK